jgi:DNA/RNA endonuclease YhcR with UshA esterase domain
MIHIKFKYIVIFLSLGSLLFLYGLSTLSQPSSISLSQVPAFEGRQVIISGRVTEYRTTSYGSQIITIQDTDTRNSSTCDLYIEGEIPIEYGDIVQATGIVQQYRSDWEIIVNNPKFVTIRQKWSNNSFPLWQLAMNPTKYVGTNVNVTGVIEKISASSCSLSDEEGRYTIIIYSDQSQRPPLVIGNAVTVRARFVYEADTFCYALHATEDNHGIFLLRR